MRAVVPHPEHGWRVAPELEIQPRDLEFDPAHDLVPHDWELMEQALESLLQSQGEGAIETAAHLAILDRATKRLGKPVMTWGQLRQRLATPRRTSAQFPAYLALASLIDRPRVLQSQDSDLTKKARREVETWACFTSTVEFNDRLGYALIDEALLVDHPAPLPESVGPRLQQLTESGRAKDILTGWLALTLTRVQPVDPPWTQLIRELDFLRDLESDKGPVVAGANIAWAAYHLSIIAAKGLELDDHGQWQLRGYRERRVQLPTAPERSRLHYAR